MFTISYQRNDKIHSIYIFEQTTIFCVKSAYAVQSLRCNPSVLKILHALMILYYRDTVSLFLMSSHCSISLCTEPGYGNFEMQFPDIK